MKININPKKELFKWGPIDGRLIYVDFFNLAFVHYGENFFSWPDLFWYLSKGKMIVVVDYQKLRDSGEKNFKKYILNDKNFDKYYAKWQTKLQKLLNFQENIDSKYLKELSNDEFTKILKKWFKLYLNFWTIGELPELANWGGEQMLKRELEKNINSKDFNYIFEKLSAPINLSFYQKAELNLLKLHKYIKNKKKFEEKLLAHRKKYFHILNSYNGVRILSKNYFKKELLKYSPQKIREKLEEIDNYPLKIKNEKKKIIKKYGLNKKISIISDRLAYCIWWQDNRKFYIFLANYYINIFLKEITKRYKVTFSELLLYGCEDILKLVESGKKITTNEMNKRHEGLMIYYSQDKNNLKYYSGKKLNKIVKPYLNMAVNEKIDKIKGIVVSSGKLIKAKVKILTSSSQVSKIKDGEILVTTMTTPDYIRAIKKASAVITDEGGMTCHAAIVSRELKIPCIVGTKIATKVLKDGDMIEVDATKGVVKKLNNYYSK